MKNGREEKKSRKGEDEDPLCIFHGQEISTVGQGSPGLLI